MAGQSTQDEPAVRSAFSWLLGTLEAERLRERMEDGAADPFGLTTNERMAIWAYTTELGYSNIINQNLRAGATNAHIRTLADVLTSGITKLPKHAGPTFRGMTVNQTDTELLKSYVPGSIVTAKAFTSTSKVADLAFPGNVRWAIRSQNGRILGFYSSAMHEQEILFVPGTSFHVLNVTISDAKIEVSLLELPS